MINKHHRKRLRLYIDRSFQNKFIIGYSFIIFITAIFTLAFVWLVQNKSYNLLPDGASFLVHVDTSKALNLKLDREKKIYVLDENGTPFFPLKSGAGNTPKLFNAFDLYLFPILFTTFVNMLIISIFNLFFSHKMAGPIFNIKRALKNYIYNSEEVNIKLRTGDYFQELASLINRAMEKNKKSK